MFQFAWNMGRGELWWAAGALVVLAVFLPIALWNSHLDERLEAAEAEWKRLEAEQERLFAERGDLLQRMAEALSRAGRGVQ
jgi:hypothetical protein